LSFGLSIQNRRVQLIVDDGRDDRGGEIVALPAGRVECANEPGPTKWTVPYRHAVWLAKAIFSVSHQAFERQKASGEIEPVAISQEEALRVEDIQVLVKPNQQLAAIDSLGTWTSNSSPGTTTLLIDSTLAQALIDQLREFVQMAQALSRPS